MYSENVVIWLAASIAILDVLFIMVAVPESLPEKLRPASWGSQISWEKADPFGVKIKLSFSSVTAFPTCHNVGISFKY